VTGIRVETFGSSLARDDIGTLEAEGCFPEGTRFEWSVPATSAIVGAGPRVNVHTGSVGANLVVRLCAVGATTDCRTESIPLEPPRPRVEVDTVAVVHPYSNGAVYRIEGNVAHAPPGTTLRLFKHSDVHYLDGASAVIDEAGRFAFEAFALTSVDRFVVELLAARGLGSMPRCSSSWCRGAIEELSGHHVPVVPDGDDAFAFGTAYIDHPGDHPDPHVDALIDLMSDEAIGVTGALVRSSWESDLCFLYGQAVAAIALGEAGDRARAEQILDALMSLQLPDGSWYFAYWEDGSSPFPGEGDFRYSGAVAWAALAFARHRRQFGTSRYDATLSAVFDYLRGMTETDPGKEGLRFNPSDLAHTSWDETRVVAFEHNADALAAFRMAPDLDTSGQAALLEQVLLSRWSGTYFRPGFHLDNGENWVEIYLDPQTWGLLALGADSARTHGAALTDACGRFTDSAGVHVRESGILGLYDFDVVWDTHPHGRFAWVEGTTGMALALDRFSALTGTASHCGSESSASLRLEMERLTVPGVPGAVAEATVSPDSPYRSIPTLAATAWSYLAASGVNPFQ
tara:strand:- start:2209 stop:3921 length:1713 start_codon:yes stop_codon:yes gene_type:complete